MAGFKGKTREGAPKGTKKTKGKEFKVNAKPKDIVEKTTVEHHLDNSTKVNIPRMFPDPDSERSIDLFIVNALNYENPHEFIPYFIGSRTIVDYNDIIKQSSPNITPDDIMESEPKITNMGKRGERRR